MSEQAPKNEGEEILAEVRGIIETVGEGIEESFAKGADTWAQIFGNKIFSVQTYLDPLRRRHMITDEQMAQLDDAIDRLNGKVSKLKELYPTRETVPAAYVKDEIITEFKRLLAVLPNNMSL